MISLYVLDVEEWRPVIDTAAAQDGVARIQVGPYVRLDAEGELTIDRRTTGVRHAVWYSAVAGVRGAVVQFDKDALRVTEA